MFDMAFQIKVIDFERARHELTKELENYRPKKMVTVGFHAKGKGGQKHRKGDLTVVQIARINHYGAGKIPARPFLDVSIQNKKDTLADSAKRYLQRGETPDQVVKRLGVQAVGIVQEYITDLREPPNAPSTIRRKKSSNPLIDTGQMRQAVTFKLRPKK